MIEPFVDQDAGVRAFLLTNFVQAGPSDPQAKFRVPLDVIGNSISEMGSFPYEPGERTWDGKTLFIKGTKSRFVILVLDHLARSHYYFRVKIHQSSQYFFRKNILSEHGFANISNWTLG